MHNINFMNFGLSDEILRTLKKLGYETPTDVQEQIIPLAMEDKDIIVKAQTGSGKTAAFAIPICEKIELEHRAPQVLVLTPTRELAVQVQEDFSNIGRFKRIRAAAIYGQQPIYMQKTQLRQRVHVVVATPGRILDHLERKTVNLEEIRYFIIDEADEMLNMGFIDQVEEIINSLPRNRVTMLFSATMPDEIEHICNQHMISPARIKIVSENPTTEKIQQFYYEVEEHEKFNLLNKIIYTYTPNSCILFCHTREKVDKLLQLMKAKDYSCIGLHGGMEQRDRLSAMERFKRGEIHFLAATDIAARGIDIEDLSLVINYDLPFEKEKYVHRIGRTGRIGKEGIAITFVSPYEIRFLKEIEEYVNYKIPKQEWPSLEDVEQGKIFFEKTFSTRTSQKIDSSAELNREITKIRINAGKRKKMRPGDILGALCNIEGIRVDDIGIIDIQDNFSYVDILADKGSLVLEALQDVQVKGRKVNVTYAK